ADIMNIFDVRLHEVPRLPLAMALAVAFRLFVGVYLAELILYLRLRFQIALTTTELIDLLETAKPQARRMAADTLGTRTEAADTTGPVLRATVARDDNADVRLAAEDAIYRLGPTAAGVLLARLADYDLPEQCLEEELLARMRLDWRRHPETHTALVRAALFARSPVAGDALLAMGADSIPGLARELAHNEPVVCKRAERLLDRIDSRWAQTSAGKDAMHALVDKLVSGEDPERAAAA